MSQHLFNELGFVPRRDESSRLRFDPLARPGSRLGLWNTGFRGLHHRSRERVSALRFSGTGDPEKIPAGNKGGDDLTDLAVPIILTGDQWIAGTVEELIGIDGSHDLEEDRLPLAQRKGKDIHVGSPAKVAEGDRSQLDLAGAGATVVLDIGDSLADLIESQRLLEVFAGCSQDGIVARSQVEQDPSLHQLQHSRADR